MLQVLADHSADLNRADDDGATPTFLAAEGGHLEALRLLHRQKARLHEPCAAGLTALHIAAANAHLDVVTFLARHGADVAHLDDEGDSALEYARAEGHVAVAALLAAVEKAGGWRDYVAQQRLPWCRIRHEVARSGKVLPENHDQQALYHFVFGGQDEAGGGGGGGGGGEGGGPAAKREKPSVLRAAPDDVFAMLGRFLF